MSDHIRTPVPVHELPRVHPGTPPFRGVRFDVVLISETQKALKITPLGRPGVTIWVPKVAVIVGLRHRLDEPCEPTPNDRRCWLPVHSITVKMWMYRKLFPELCE